jgi:hypothetical protein
MTINFNAKLDEIIKLQNNLFGSGNDTVTPSAVVEKCLTGIDFNNIHLKLYDPACGHGAFLIGAIKFFFNSKCHQSKFPNSLKRIKHIIKNQIYGNDLQIKKTKVICSLIDSLVPNVKKNIENYDFLNYNVDMKFDYIVSNYPFKDPNKKKSTGTMNIWPAFTEKCLGLLKDENSKLIPVVPGSWMKNSRDILRAKDAGGSKNLFNDYMKQKNLIYINIGEGEKYFKEGSTFTWFVLENKPYEKKTKIDVADKNNDFSISSGEIDISSLKSIRYANNFLEVSINAKAQAYSEFFSFSSHETYKRKPRATKKDKNYRYPCLNYKIKPSLEKERYDLVYLLEPHPLTKKRKIHIPYVGPTIPYVDDGRFGVIHGQVYLLKENELVESAEDVMYSKLFKFLFSENNGLHNESGVMNIYFKPDLSRRWTDEELYKEIGLTDEEIKFVENFNY